MILTGRQPASEISHIKVFVCFWMANLTANDFLRILARSRLIDKLATVLNAFSRSQMLRKLFPI